MSIEQCVATVETKSTKKERVAEVPTKEDIEHKLQEIRETLESSELIILDLDGTMVGGYDVVRPGLREFLHYYKSQGKKFAVSTDQPTSYAMAILAAHRILGYFSTVDGYDNMLVTSQDQDSDRKNPAGISGRNHQPINKAVFVGDNPIADGESAKSHDIPFIHVATYFWDDIYCNGDPIVKSFLDLVPKSERNIGTEYQIPLLNGQLTRTPEWYQFLEAYRSTTSYGPQKEVMNSMEAQLKAMREDIGQRQDLRMIVKKMLTPKPKSMFDRIKTQLAEYLPTFAAAISYLRNNKTQTSTNS